MPAWAFSGTMSHAGKNAWCIYSAHATIHGSIFQLRYRRYRNNYDIAGLPNILKQLVGLFRGSPETSHLARFATPKRLKQCGLDVSMFGSFFMYTQVDE